jgi:hypothetical protein
MLAHFGLSWWSDVVPMLVDDGDGPNLLPNACVELAELIEQAEYVGGSATQEGAFIRTVGAAVTVGSGDEPVTISEPHMAQREWYEADRDRLVAFLRRGAAAGGVVASL